MTYRETYIYLLQKRGATLEEATTSADDVIARRRTTLGIHVSEIRHTAISMVVEATGLPVFSVSFRPFIPDDDGCYPLFFREIPAKNEQEARQEAEAWRDDCEIVEVEPTYG